MQLPDDFYFNQSNLKDYVDCPRRFYLRHVQRLPWPAVPIEPALEWERETERGARFHRLAQQFFLGVPEDRLSAGLDEEMRAWWAAFAQTARPLLPLRPRAETSLIGRIAGAALLAKYDLLLPTAGGGAPGAVIYDWKTVRRLPRAGQLAGHLQTRVYRWVLAQTPDLQPEQIEMVYWFANFPDQPARLPYSRQEYEHDQRYLEGLTGDILRRSADEFVLTDRAETCAFCQYRSFCGRGTSAGTAGADDLLDLPEAPLNLDDVAEIAL